MKRLNDIDLLNLLKNYLYDASVFSTGLCNLVDNLTTCGVLNCDEAQKLLTIIKLYKPNIVFMPNANFVNYIQMGYYYPVGAIEPRRAYIENVIEQIRNQPIPTITGILWQQN